MNEALTVLIPASRERALLAAARSVFVEQGFEASAISEIARRAGVATGTVYLYFDNKRTLLHHVLADFVTALTSDIEAHLQEIDGHPARLRYVIARHLQALIAEPELSALFVREVHTRDSQDDGTIRSVKQRYASVLTRVLDEGMAAGAVRTDIPPALAQSIVFGGLEQLTLRTWTGRPATDGAVDAIMRLLVTPEQLAASGASLDAVLRKLDRISEKLGVTS
jgi:AcrR family transcriptional regulator